MRGIYFKQTKIVQETNETFVCSKFLGAPVFPENFLFNKNGKCILKQSDYFIMQLNLKEISKYESMLPKYGMLYFFIDVDTLKPKILYAKDIENCNLEVWDDINEHFDKGFGEVVGYKLVFCEVGAETHYLDGNINLDIDLQSITDVNGYVTLLEIDYLSLPNENMLRFGNMAIYGGRYIFLIKEEDLINQKFNKVKFIETET